MLEICVRLSLIITALFIAFSEGMVLFWLRRAVALLLIKICGRKWAMILQKPLWGCLPCMASFWVIVLAVPFDLQQLARDWKIYLEMMLIVCGINAIIGKFIDDGD